VDGTLGRADEHGQSTPMHQNKADCIIDVNMNDAVIRKAEPVQAE